MVFPQQRHWLTCNSRMNESEANGHVMELYLFPIVEPTGPLSGPEDDARAVGAIASSLAPQVVEANLALNGFHRSTLSPHRLFNEEFWEKDSRERYAIEISILRERGWESAPPEAWNQLSTETALRHLLQKFERGEEPDDFAFRQRFVYAKAFVFSIDRIQRMIEVCRHYDLARATADTALSHINDRVPDLREFRNSIAHFEDRVRGKRKVQGKGRRADIDIQPVSTPFIKTENPALVLETIEGDVFRNILADGSLGSIPIRVETMATIRDAVQTFLDGLPWKRVHRVVTPSP
jgi:hypothetical protein